MEFEPVLEPVLEPALEAAANPENRDPDDIRRIRQQGVSWARDYDDA